MDICILGQGYIGIPTAALFASNGCNVVGVDINGEIVKKLNNYEVPIEEPGLVDLIKESKSKNKYNASTVPVKSDVYIITVPTPYTEDTYECDLSYVISACKSILPYIEEGNLIIVESTIAPLSLNDIIKPLFEKEGYIIGENLFLAHCPERVLPGNMLHELVHNDRIVGGITEKCSQKAFDVYSIFVKGNIFKTEAKTAELSKCMENTFRDVNIALSNELVMICNDLGINSLDVINLANKHPRVNLHSPGPGVGGHCLAIDPYFIYNKSPKNSKIIKLARDTNRHMPIFVSEKINEISKNIINIKKITIFGVSYKGNIDDDRESPSYEIINNLIGEYDVAIYDPHIDNKEFNDFEKSIEDSDIIVILTDHNEFKDLNYDLIKQKMNKPLIFDTKNIISEVPSDIILINFGNLYEYLE